MLRTIPVLCLIPGLAIADNMDDKIAIAKFCTANGTHYEPQCNGIGPLHIPSPPNDACARLLPRARRPATDLEHLYDSREDWYKALTRAQRKYVDQKCRLGRNRGTELCYQPKHCSTPLVVTFDDAPVTFEPGVAFAFTRGASTATDWPTSRTPWIARDRDGDGEITAADELFGSATLLPDGSVAPDGFTALAALDANHDGTIDERDPAFASLLLWSDDNRDGRGTPDELAPAARSIVSISLAARADTRCDARGNCEGPRAQITWRDAAGTHTGSAVDVYLPNR